LIREVIVRTSGRDHDWMVSKDAAGRLFDRLAGLDGLTATASTFTRPDVLVALGAGLAGASRTGNVNEKWPHLACQKWPHPWCDVGRSVVGDRPGS
jgi:hypothetical protein